MYYQDLAVLPILEAGLNTYKYVQIRTNTELEDYDYNTITLRYGYVTIRYDTIREADHYDTITYEYVRKKAKDIY